MHPTRVALFHNYRECSQTSMMLYARRLGQALIRRGVDVRPVRAPNVLPFWAMRSAVLRKVDSYAGRFWRLPELARQQSADLFHIADHGQGHLVNSLNASRCVVTCHDTILLVAAAGRIPHPLLSPVAKRVLERAIRYTLRAKKVVAVSETTRRDLLAIGDVDPSRVTVIYSGLNHDLRPDPSAGLKSRETLGLGSSLVVLHVGQTAFYKNVPVLLRVLHRLRSGGVQVKLVRAGQRLDKASRSLACRLRIQDDILDLGMVDDERLIGLYNAADVLLFPSLYEGFGWPIIEAMASGLPVVCSTGGALGEVAAGAALTADPEDVAGLAERVATVLTDSRVASDLVRRGLDRARAFDWDRTASQFEGLYREILES